jgi:hypothetical protein
VEDYLRNVEHILKQDCVQSHIQFLCSKKTLCVTLGTLLIAMKKKGSGNLLTAPVTSAILVTPGSIFLFIFGVIL